MQTTNSAVSDGIQLVSGLTDFLYYLISIHIIFTHHVPNLCLSLMDFQLGKCNIPTYQTQVFSGVWLPADFTYHPLIIECQWEWLQAQVSHTFSYSKPVSILGKLKLSWNSIREENKGCCQSEFIIMIFFCDASKLSL